MSTPPPLRYWIIKGVSGIAVFYLIFSLSSPIFLKQENQPRKIETPDLILIALVLLFNSELLDKLEDFTISKDGSFEAKFKRLEQAQAEIKKDLTEKISTQTEQVSDLKKAIISYNYREDIIRKEPNLIGKELALVGLKVRSGDYSQFKISCNLDRCLC